ncbi:Isonitrile hydratase [Pseudomonas fluorescens]|nr:Isonitrile hydratase [Pseudomonas fluorescens]
MTLLSIVVFDDFSDIDLTLPWDILSRVKRRDWKVNIVGMEATHRSTLGVQVKTDERLDTVAKSDVVLIIGGEGSRVRVKDLEFLECLKKLEPGRQLIGAQCSGGLILTALGLLEGRTATTTPFATLEMEAAGIQLQQRPLVAHGNIATAGGCLASLYMTTWILYRCLGATETRQIFSQVAPVGDDGLWDVLDRAVTAEITTNL